MSNLKKAIFAIQQSITSVKKNRKNEFGNYKYADLNAVWDVLKPHFKEHKLVVTQIPNGDVLHTVVTKLNGEESDEEMTIETRMADLAALKGMNSFQTDGARITYYKRYVLSGIFGILTDDDTDAQGAQKQSKKTEQKAISLNENQFTRLLSKLLENAEKRIKGETVQQIDLNAYNFTPTQLTTLKENGYV